MAEKVGGIEYTIDVDTSGLIKAQQEAVAASGGIGTALGGVDTASKKVVSSFSAMSQSYSKTKKAATQFIAEQIKAGRVVDKNGNVLDAHGQKSKKLTSELNKLTNEYKESRDQISGVDSAIESLINAQKKSTAALKDSRKAAISAALEYDKLAKSAKQAEEELKAIDAHISVDVKDVITAKNKVYDSTNAMQKDFYKVDDAIKDLITRQIQLGNTVDKTGRVIDSAGNEVKDATIAMQALTAKQNEMQKSAQKMSATYKNLTASTNQVAVAHKKLNASTAGASKGLGGMGRKAGQAGVQIEQFVGQVQGGGDIMRAFSYQATDLGIVLGAPLVGAAVGLGAALLAALIPSLFGSSEATQDLIDKLKELRETGSLNAEQARFLASQEGLTQKERKKSIETLKEEIKENEALILATQKRGKIGRGSKTESAEKRNAEAVREIEMAIEEQRVTLGLLNEEYKKGQKDIDNYNAAASGNIIQSEEQKKTVEGLIAALKEEEFALKNNARQVLENNLAKEGATQADIAVALATYDSNKAKKEEIETDKESKKLAEKKAETMAGVLSAYQNQAAQLELNSKAQDEYNARRRLSLEDGEKLPDSIQAEIDKLEELRIKKAEMAEQAKADRVIEQEFKTLSEDVSAGGMTEIERIQEEFEAKRALIQEHTALLLEDENLAVEDKVALAEKAAGLIKSVEDKAARDRENLAEREQKAKLAAISNAFGQLSSLMNTESKKMFEIGKAAAIAGALVDGYAAVQGAIKAGNKIGGPPLGAAFGAAAAVQTAVQVRNISKQKIGGASSAGATSSFSGGLPAQRSAGGGGFGDRNVTIAGLDPSSMFSGEQVRDLLKNLAGDGADFTFLSSGG